MRSVSKQGQLQPRCHSEARSLSQQLLNGLLKLNGDQDFVCVVALKRAIFSGSINNHFIIFLELFILGRSKDVSAKMFFFKLQTFFYCSQIKLLVSEMKTKLRITDFISEIKCVEFSMVSRVFSLKYQRLIQQRQTILVMFFISESIV